ncbi:guanylate-binding protein 5 isoform X1 [Tupaia chinensis]|uniref:guanylate-binding protein 5 isoform X1 n=1 Tax=Tupaia chinensis TaxID=246437 RepID=UPI0003C8DDB5|nr:guanylate-binding protein 5 isoform X1 [Tupaia chinensis]
MAAEIHMPDPVCLIENLDEELQVNPEAVKILSTITQPLVVVAIVGLYRTGKSYLMNRLAGRTKGFSVGGTVQSHTKGIWMWCMPHPENPNHTLVLLDTEGLGDVEKVDHNKDTQIFALAILLCSTFVYNTKNKVDQEAIDLLHKVTELTDLLQTRTSPSLDKAEGAADFVSFFPDLVWTLRDFYLDLEVDGRLITVDEYLENSLKIKEGCDERIQKFNLPRQCIQRFFPVRKCFIFDLPAPGKKLTRLETLPENELNPEFVQQVEKFCSYVWSSAVKTLPGGIKVDGPCLENLVLTYVNAINSGDLPCMENAVLVMAEKQNSAAVQKAIAHYDQQMGQRVQLPTETLQELLDLHRASEKEATEIFMKNAFKDVDQSFQKELETLLDARRIDICNRNLEASLDHCSALLQDIFRPLEEAVKQGIYSKPGGHNLFIQKTEELKAMYYQTPKKGVQAEEALQKYLNSKESISDAILQTDQALTAKEKEMEEARVKAEAAKAEARRLEEIQRRNQQMMEEKERLHQEQLRQIEINEANRRAAQAERLRALEREHQKQAEELKRKLEDDRRKLENELLNLQRTAHSNNDPCILL